jgi:hypothetical protein
MRPLVKVKNLPFSATWIPGARSAAIEKTHKEVDNGGTMPYGLGRSTPNRAAFRPGL